MQSCSGYPHPNVVQHFEVLELPNKKGLEVRGIGKAALVVEKMLQRCGRCEVLLMKLLELCLCTVNKL